MKTRSFLKWAGSKYNCLHEVISALPKGRRLIEPFAGSAVIFMNTQFDSYILAENNPDLTQIYTSLKDEGASFINLCQQYFHMDMNCKEKYYESRDEFNQLNYSHKRAALFLYLNRHGYNGLCRYNSKGIFNVPFGSYIKPYFPRNEMQLFHEKSHLAHFVHHDFRKTFQLAEQGDVIYCDPPYVPYSAHTKAFGYTAHKFSEEDQIDLAKLATETAARGITVIISNHDTPFTRHHYQKAQIKSFPVHRWISCSAKTRKPVKEIIAVFKK